MPNGIVSDLVGTAHSEHSQALPALSPRLPSAAAAYRNSVQDAVDGSRMFIAGGVAGAVARTCTAPLDRIKLLFQVQAIPSSGCHSPAAYTSIRQACSKIFREEGMLAFWKGNGTNVLRIFPLSAAQLAANDQFKRLLAEPRGGRELTVPRRLASGAAAGMTATALTHPLDVVRLRLALPSCPYTGTGNAIAVMVRTEGLGSLFKGLTPALVGVAPYAAINFATYDLQKKWYYGDHDRVQEAGANLVMGGASGTLAATVCYPLDTIRRRMQMQGFTYSSQADAFQTIWRTEGFRGFYRGWAANALKIVPANAIRLVSYEAIKQLLGVRKAATDT